VRLVMDKQPLCRGSMEISKTGTLFMDLYNYRCCPRSNSLAFSPLPIRRLRLGRARSRAAFSSVSWVVSLQDSISNSTLSDRGNRIYLRVRKSECVKTEDQDDSCSCSE
jgi:hypothetical protein